VEAKMAGNIVRDIDDWMRIKNVLISVSDKQGLEILVPGLISINDSLKIYSTGGTYKRIADHLGPDKAAKHLVQVSDYTGQPETQGGLVKTLDFKIYLGLLTETYNESHQEDLKRTEAVALDMVVVNLYPFQQTVAKPGVSVEEARANIDIGGPCMVRASAKNYLRVCSVTDPADYEQIIKKLRTSGGRIDLKTRFALAKKAFAHTAEYDTHISKYLAEQTDGDMENCYHKMGV
jgi:phosphoribosylaminoimidazolecarboxamide formyltransferase/IMP cyclohydrolase